MLKSGSIKVKIRGLANMAVYLSGGKDRYSVEKLFNDGSAIDQT